MLLRKPDFMAIYTVRERAGGRGEISLAMCAPGAKKRTARCMSWMRMISNG